MNYKKSIFISVLAINVLACKNQKKVERVSSNTETIAVKTYILQKGEGEITINSTGMLSTENEAKYSFKIGGVVDRIYLNEGQFFKKGELLAKLKINEIDAGFIQAKLGLEKAERDLARISNLYKDSVATLEQLQNTKTAFEIAQKQLEAVSFNKEYAFIYAASDGFVSKKIANEGEIIAGGMPVFAINENIEDSWVLKVGLSDKDWALVETGNNASIILDAYPDKILTGIVFRKSLAADMASGSFLVEIKVKCEGISPALGMFGKAVIKTKKIEKYKSIPYDALIEADGKMAYVFVPISNGKVKKQAIEIADFDNDKVYIRSGLDEINEVVLTNSAFLNSNSIITIIK
jgi:RND family efflux transporter MFP subunit